MRQDPLYEKLAKRLIDRIAKGVYPPGSALPSQLDLKKEFEVSAGTVAKAVKVLEQRKILNTVQTKGVFVRAHTPETAQFHFFRFRNNDGSPVEPQLESQRIIYRKSTQLEYSKLHGEPDYVYQIERVRACNGMTCVHEVSVLPAPLFPELEKHQPLPNTLYVMFQEQYHIVVVHAEELVHSKPLCDEIARKLERDAGKPSMIIRREAYDMLGRVVELRKSLVITDGIYYSISMS